MHAAAGLSCFWPALEMKRAATDVCGCLTWSQRWIVTQVCSHPSDGRADGQDCHLVQERKGEQVGYLIHVLRHFVVCMS